MKKSTTRRKPARIDDETFLRRFETASWPLKQWHHRQHIKAAYLYLRRHPFDAAMTKMRAGIKAYNAAHKVPESLLSGYHETMTHAWMRLVHFSLSEYGPAENADALFEKNEQLSEKKILRFFYTRKRFISRKAKAKFVAPDRIPLPVSEKKAKSA